jgi:DNA polymerase III subunit epsilon
MALSRVTTLPGEESGPPPSTSAASTSSSSGPRGPEMEPLFAVVDVETSGLRPGRDHVLQIAVVTVDAGGTVVDRWSTLVRPRRWWHRVGPRHIHGITRRSLRSAPPAGEAFAELASRLTGSVFTAHNVNFDAEFIERAAHRAGVRLVIEQRVCTLDLSRQLDPDRQLTHGLAELCARYGVPLTAHHDALADATATAAVLPHLLRAHQAAVDHS